MAAKRHKGRLVVVQIGPRYYVKMVESEAIAKGLLKTGPRRPGKDAASSSGTGGARVETVMEKIIDVPEVVQEAGLVPKPDPVDPDDFTEIVGVGKATDQALHENGIHTFEDLLDADVSFLSKQGQKAVEEWRKALDR
jgi:predicted flap endonuclease-1-like 5' DNA nuclease